MDARRPLPGWLPVLLAVTTVLAFSRVYLGVHYVGDVVAGLAFGLVFGGLYVCWCPRRSERPVLARRRGGPRAARRSDPAG